ncbi:MAG: hypothetical protein HXX19_10595 [Rhodoferax sp.]|nr:hypothetical protein [Rhodoferax sp.]
MTHPLLQMIRVIGFGEVLRWLREAGLDQGLPAVLPEDVCDLCPSLVTRPAIANYLCARAAQPENRLRIGILANRILGENQLLRRALLELRPLADAIDGFHLAEQLLVDATPPPQPAALPV